MRNINHPLHGIECSLVWRRNNESRRCEASPRSPARCANGCQTCRQFRLPSRKWFPQDNRAYNQHRTLRNPKCKVGIRFLFRVARVVQTSTFYLQDGQFINDSNGYSSTICGWLEADGHRLVLAQVGPDYCVVRRTVPLPPTKAEIVIEIDGNQRRRKVFLNSGISDSSRVVQFTDR